LWEGAERMRDARSIGWRCWWWERRVWHGGGRRCWWEVNDGAEEGCEKVVVVGALGGRCGAAVVDA